MRKPPSDHRTHFGPLVRPLGEPQAYGPQKFRRNPPPATIRPSREIPQKTTQYRLRSARMWFGAIPSPVAQARNHCSSLHATRQYREFFPSTSREAS